MRTTTFTFLDYLPDPLRELPKRRAAELIGIWRARRRRRACAALLTWSVDDPSLNHATVDADPQSARRAGRDRRRHRHAVLRPRLRRRACPAGLLGLAADDAHKRLDRVRYKLVLWLIGSIAAAGLRFAAAGAGELAAADRPRRRRRRRGPVGAAPACSPRSPLGMTAASASPWRRVAILTLTAAAGYHLMPARRDRRRAPPGRTPPRRAARPSATTARTRMPTASPASASSRSAR